MKSKLISPRPTYDPIDPKREQLLHYSIIKSPLHPAIVSLNCAIEDCDFLLESAQIDDDLRECVRLVRSDADRGVKLLTMAAGQRDATHREQINNSFRPRGKSKPAQLDSAGMKSNNANQ